MTIGFKFARNLLSSWSSYDCHEQPSLLNQTPQGHKATRVAAGGCPLQFPLRKLTKSKCLRGEGGMFDGDICLKGCSVIPNLSFIVWILNVDPKNPGMSYRKGIEPRILFNREVFGFLGRHGGLPLIDLIGLQIAKRQS